MGFTKQLQNLVIERILWSPGGSQSDLIELNNMTSALTSRYDIFYQDSMDPAKFPNLTGFDSDWTSSGFPNEIVINSTGGWEHGWESPRSVVFMWNTL